MLTEEEFNILPLYVKLAAKELIENYKQYKQYNDFKKIELENLNKTFSNFLNVYLKIAFQDLKNSIAGVK